MIAIGGIKALSDFRKVSMLARLKTADTNITDVSAEFVHFIDGHVAEADRQKLEGLLAYGEKLAAKKDGLLFLVIPRPGTISPWSSKATDIAHSAGLKGIKRIERGTAFYITSRKALKRAGIKPLLYDRMTEAVLDNMDAASVLFSSTEPSRFKTIDILGKDGKTALDRANKALLLALSAEEIDYLYSSYKQLGRNPTDAELMMFGVVNSEHCRHKIFNAAWEIDGFKHSDSLFSMIKNTYKKSPSGVLSAYSDNAAVLEGGAGKRFLPDPDSNEYKTRRQTDHLVIKAETHNHPTAISPYPGSATGTGGEIRDEAATGRGAASKMGLAGFSVSNLRIPGFAQPWEKNYGKPDHISSPLDIMIEGPLGAAGFANEFGRPGLSGYFRTYEQVVDGEIRGYHKPLMIGGGLGSISDFQVEKRPLPNDAAIIVLGGPAMLIGLGGGSGSSLQLGQTNTDLDFASVQRDNAEMQRRAQEVISTCTRLGEKNPILSIHDVGAGGLSNAIPEFVDNAGKGAEIELRDIPNDEPGMSPMEIWCNEAQERFVLAAGGADLTRFEEICRRERCPFAVVGRVTPEPNLTVRDRHFGNNPVEIPLKLLFGSPPKTTHKFDRKSNRISQFKLEPNLDEAVERVLRLPAVASKKFLITIGDRTVGGLVARDQMVGKWQVPVSDVAVTSRNFEGLAGEAMSIGERTPLAVIDSAASARMAVAEAITNIAAADISKLSDIKLSANWMAASGHNGEDQKLYEAVHALGRDFCPELGIAIPVGKDSLNMKTVWKEGGKRKSATSPMSVIISAFAAVKNVCRTLTPELKAEENSLLVLIDLGQGKSRLGGSALAQVYGQSGDEAPDVDPHSLRDFFAALARLKRADKILAYHDRSDGGLFATLAEMSFASRLGAGINLDKIPGENAVAKLFSEEAGAVIQIHTKDAGEVLEMFDSAYVIGSVSQNQRLVFKEKDKVIYQNTRANLEQIWAETSFQVQSLRDNPECAKQEFDSIADNKDPGLQVISPRKLRTKDYRLRTRPRMAILREQGVNGQTEMAAAFTRAGFTAVDVHMQDLLDGRCELKDFRGLAICGGFSYGDVLGGGGGWAKSVLFNAGLRKMFKEFFHRPDTFSLGICNGCQMMSALKEIIPGAGHWPRFLANTSGRFEARLVMTRINKTPSIFFKGMKGSLLPVPTAHGEGRVVFGSETEAKAALGSNLVPLQFVNNYGKATRNYPANPNGSADGITALTTEDGRATIIMPHPERVFLTKQLSWHPDNLDKESPWFRIFQNAREWMRNG